MIAKTISFQAKQFYIGNADLSLVIFTVSSSSLKSKAIYASTEERRDLLEQRDKNIRQGKMQVISVWIQHNFNSAVNISYWDKEVVAIWFWNEVTVNCVTKCYVVQSVWCDWANLIGLYVRNFTFQFLFRVTKCVSYFYLIFDRQIYCWKKLIPLINNKPVNPTGQSTNFYYWNPQLWCILCRSFSYLHTAHL